ncbi:protein-lysine N-methyltransferase SMYD4 isoform X2 [Nomia melanderi]
MIKVLMDIPCVKTLIIAESYRGKDDVKAAEVYSKIGEAIAGNGVAGEQESRISVLTETLFAASVTSRLFLRALSECAQHCYDLKAFTGCLRYCECMLALPAGLYDKTGESMSDFLERRRACAYLRDECFKMLKRSSSRGRRTRRKCDQKQSSSSEDASRNGQVPARATATVPVVDGKRHPVLQSCSDAVALEFDEKRGRRLVATRNIKAGSVLIVERPFAFATNKDALDTNCSHCHVSFKSSDTVKIPCRFCRAVGFCSEKCREEAWSTYHRFECCLLDGFYENRSEETQLQVSRLLLAYRMTVIGSLSSKSRNAGSDDNVDNEIPFLDDDFLRCHDTEANEGHGSEPGISEIYRSQDYRTVLALTTHCATLDSNVNLIRAIEAVFLTKCFIFALGKMDVVCLKEAFLWLAVGMFHHLQAIQCNAYEIVENVYKETSHVWEPREIGGAIYPTVSLVNHSCYPNVVRHSYPAGTVVVRTLRFIGKGKEILDCYGPHFLSEKRLQRREHLERKYHFLCECEACMENWQYPLPETMIYKCSTCSEGIGVLPSSEKNTRYAAAVQCRRCNERIDCKKLEVQFRKSVDKRLNAISKMYEGCYAQALPQLLEHIHFIEKFFLAPNIETIKTQQCIIQCYNQFGCISQ